ncbi:hypothetical protein M6D93_15825 [Jatrophihabitans telluris]|uniref:Uncharacterized protein n=1 Tax=Jatrophihabitans telluris TaxID=2038343 RepID=A0ABY4QXN1_9ACTN|nr:hypothetical protein [Jatrophihabitans telluris]UQX87756.1 hypothetical protein M6D93_15825 [Jatrophihabitans telluris]
MPDVPMPLKVALGLAATAADELRKLPETLPAAVSGVPMVAVSTAMQASMKVQQRLAVLAAKGEEVLHQLRGTSDEPPSWATFDEDGTGAAVASSAASNDSASAPLRAAFDTIDYENIGYAEADEEEGRWGAVGSSAVPVEDAPADKAPAAKAPAVKRAAAKKPTVSTPAAKTPAAKIPAAKIPAAKTPAAKTPAAKAPAASAPAAKKAAKRPALKTVTPKTAAAKKVAAKVGAKTAAVKKAAPRKTSGSSPAPRALTHRLADELAEDLVADLARASEEPNDQR